MYEHDDFSLQLSKQESASMVRAGRDRPRFRSYIPVGTDSGVVVLCQTEPY